MTSKVIGWIAGIAGTLVVGLVIFWVATRPSSPTSKPPVQTVQKTAECPGAPQTFDLASGEKKVLNPNACQLRWKIRTGCVRALDAEGTVLSPKVCAGGGEATVPSGLHTVVALDTVKVRRTECGRRATGSNLDSCD